MYKMRQKYASTSVLTGQLSDLWQTKYCIHAPLRINPLDKRHIFCSKCSTVLSVICFCVTISLSNNVFDCYVTGEKVNRLTTT